MSRHRATHDASTCCMKFTPTVTSWTHHGRSRTSLCNLVVVQKKKTCIEKFKVLLNASLLQYQQVFISCTITTIYVSHSHIKLQLISLDSRHILQSNLLEFYSFFYSRRHRVQRLHSYRTPLLRILQPMAQQYLLQPGGNWLCTQPKLTHWGPDKMAAIFQTTFSNAFSWMKMYEFRFRFHWSLFLRVQLTIYHYLNQGWKVYWRIYVSLGLNELTHGGPEQIDGLVHERCNSGALAMELCLSCINPSK